MKGMVLSSIIYGHSPDSVFLIKDKKGKYAVEKAAKL
jgi:hypothetical protein